MGQIPPLGQILAGLDSSDPAAYRQSLDAATADFRALEAASPGAIRPDVARLREGVALVVDAVEANPDDLPAAREAITARASELSGLAQAGQAVVDYTQQECGITLGDLGGSAPPVTTQPGG